jgi:SAM-dependent methyltransferase
MSGHQHGHGHGGHGSARHGDIPTDAASWDQWYSATDTVWSGRPNPQLVSDAADLTPGTALDIGCGEGADSLWLAQRGWRVTAVDISDVALARAAANATAADAPAARLITWVRTDITAALPDGPFDLVSAQFMHLPQAERDVLWRGLAAVVAPGGSLLVVGHHPSDLATAMPRPDVPGMYYTPSDVGAVLDPADWRIVVSEARPRAVAMPDGQNVTINDAVFLAQRGSAQRGSA